MFLEFINLSFHNLTDNDEEREVNILTRQKRGGRGGDGVVISGGTITGGTIRGTGGRGGEHNTRYQGVYYLLYRVFQFISSGSYYLIVY